MGITDVTDTVREIRDHVDARPTRRMPATSCRASSAYPLPDDVARRVAASRAS